MTRYTMIRIAAILISIVTCLLCKKSIANDINININVNINYGLNFSYSYINLKNKDFEYVDKYERLKDPISQLSRLSLNSIISYKKYSVYISTNRMFASYDDRRIRRKSDGKIFINSNKIIIDSLILSRAVNHNMTTGIILNNVESKSYLLYNNDIIKYENKHSLIGGFNISYKTNDNCVYSISYIFPNKELNLINAISVNLNYLF